MRELTLADLRGGMPALTPASGERLAEAASYCLDEQGHEQRVVLAVAGDHTESFVLERLAVDEVIRRTYDDQEEATEEGACAIAILLARELTGWSVVRRVRQKRLQTTQSDESLGHLSAYVIVVEFSHPQARVERR